MLRVGLKDEHKFVDVKIFVITVMIFGVLTVVFGKIKVFWYVKLSSSSAQQPKKTVRP